MTEEHYHRTQSRLAFDSMASYQYFRVFRVKAHFTPEEKLMFAVLNDAIECLDKYHEGKRRREIAMYREAKEWVSSDSVDGIFSFVNVCETLKLDAEYLRLGLWRWLERRQATKRGFKLWREPLRYRTRIRERRRIAY